MPHFIDTTLPWHTQDIRPITRTDVGRFLVGYGLPGWICGYVEQLHGDYMVIDTGRSAGPLNGNVVTDVVQLYTFLDGPPLWVASHHGAAQSAA